MAKSHRKAPSIELRKIVSEVLKEYGDEVEREVAEAIPDVADNVVRELYETSPKGETGDYAKGWTYSYVTSKYGTVTVKVHNATDWQLTHLLEWGHAIKRGGRTVGRANAYPHIKQRNEYAKELLIKKVEERIK